MSSTSPTKGSPTRRVKLDLNSGKPPDSNTPEATSTPKRSQPMSIIPEWASKAASNKKSWKLLVRCWIATWVCFVLILPNKTLAAMGNAAFFAAIASFIAPPAMPLQIYFFAMLTLMIGCLLGWAWGSAGMAAALQARDQVLLRNTLLSTQQAAANQANPDAYFQKAIFRGDFLDTRSTVVFGVFLGVGAFVLALMRVKSPKLTLASIFGTIFLDVICSYGPLFPFAEYLILQTFLVSSSIYIAVGIVVIIFVFPETLNHEWLESYAGVLDLIKGLVDLQEKVLTDSPDQLDPNAEDSTISKLNALQAGALAAFQAFSSKSPMLNLEFSYGRWSAQDVQGLELPLRALLTRARGLTSFPAQYSHHLRTRMDSLPPSNAVSRAASMADDDTPSGTRVSNDTVSKKSKRKHVALQVQDTHRLMHVRGHVTALEVAQHTHITEMIPILYSATADLRKSLSKALENMSAAIRDVNGRRYRSVKSEPLDNLRSAREALRTALSTYKESGRIAIIQPLADAVDAVSGKLLDEHGRPTVSFRPLFICFVLESHLCWTAEAVLSLTDRLIELMEERGRNRLWAPTGLRKIFNLLRREEGTTPIQGDSNPMPEPSQDDEYSRVYRRDPDARPPKGLVQNLTYALWSVWSFFRTNEAIFAVKYTVVTIALWLPQVIRSSAEFTYNEKGLWALIMAQFGLNMYMSDQIGQFVARILGTVGGGVIGMLIWYIGSGHGTGNAYGLAAAFGVFMIPMLFLRLFWTQRMVESIMLAVTSVLVAGYSWIDTHLASQGNPGYGYEIFWRRVVLVLVGFAASFVMMILPPQSSRKALRLGSASTIADISRLYGLLISSWLTVEEETEDEKANGKEDAEDKPMSHPYEKWKPAFRAKLMSVATRLMAQKIQMNTVKWERNIRGSWPAEHYEKLLEIQATMLADLIQLSGSLSVLSPKWRNRLLHKTAFLNPNLISDVMAIFGIVSMSLETGHPVHDVLPSNLLDRSLYHDEQSRILGARFKQFDRVDGEEAVESAPTGDENLTAQKLMSMEYSTYATGVAAAFHLLHALDQIHLITKELCGVVPLEGYSRWREEYEIKHLSRSV